MALVPPIKDLLTARQAIQKLAATKLGPTSTPKFKGLTLTDFTQGSILFAGSGGLLSQDNAGLFWDDTNNRLGLGTASPDDELTVKGDGARINISSADFENIVMGNRGVAALDTAYAMFKVGGVNTIVLDTAGDSYFNGGNVGIGTPAPNAPLEVKGAKPGEVGGWQSGQLQVTGDGTEFYCAVITGHNAFNGNTQLWYLGSTSSSSHNDIAFINRQNAPIHFYTNNTSRMTIDAAGNVTLNVIAAESSDVDKFLVSSSGVVKYRTGTQVLSDIGGQTQGDVLDDLNTLGANAADSEFLVGTGIGALAWENAATAKTSIGLGNVENTALSTWAGTTNITTLGTIATVGNITIANGGTIGQAAGPLLTFNDTSDSLGITGCKVGIGVLVASFLLDLQQSSTTGGGGTYPSIRIINTNTDVTGGNLSVADTQWITLNDVGGVVFQLLAISSAAASYSRIGTLSDHDVQFWTNSSAKATLSKEGNFGLGGTPTSQRLYVEEDSNNTLVANFKNTGDATPYGINIDFSAASPDNQTQYFIAGEDSTAAEFNIWSDGSFAQVSDRKVKKNIVDTSPKLAEIMKLRVVDFNRKNDKSLRNHTGLIAQEIKEIFPHLISYSKKGEKNERLMLNNIGLAPLAIKAIQELKVEKDAEIKQLKVEIAALKARAA